jgi:hypothetical protein
MLSHSAVDFKRPGRNEKDERFLVGWIFRPRAGSGPLCASTMIESRALGLASDATTMEENHSSRAGTSTENRGRDALFVEN